MTINTLVAITSKDRSHEVRSELIKAMSILSQQEGEYRIHQWGFQIYVIQTHPGPEQSRKILETFGKGMEDEHWKPRQSWVESIAPHIKDGTSGSLVPYHIVVT